MGWHGSAESISVSDLHQAVLVTMAAKFARVAGMKEWIAVISTE
jgi:hypothetical protein